MNEVVSPKTSEFPAEAILRDELAQGDLALGAIGPVLGHLLANHDRSLFSEEIVTRVRGMVGDIARRLLVAEAEAAGEVDLRGPDGKVREELTSRLLAEGGLVTHCHALSLEWQLTVRLENRSGIDPVLSPLLQALVASDDASTASTAMAALAAQARFVQQQRRMELPVEELPPDLFDRVIGASSECTTSSSDPADNDAGSGLRRRYDESASRLGLLARLVAGMGAGALAALTLSHAGPGIFLSAVAGMTGQGRGLIVVSTNDRQIVRLALALRAAGLKPREVEEQLLHIHPDVALPEGFEALRPERAAALLAASGRQRLD